MRERTTAILLVAVVALGAMTGVAAADGHLEVAVDDDGAQPTVTVTDENGTAVENATVNVSAVDAENESYAGAGSYESDANGTVELPAPEEDVTVEVNVTSGNDTASTTADLEAPDGLEVAVDDTDGEPVVTVTDNDTAVENASVNVTTADENASYAGTGDYETDENGTVALPAAEENVTVDVTAEFGNETASTTVDLTTGEQAAEDRPFGQLVREFIEQIDDRDGGIGDAVSDFVTENNPGNAPDHAGGPGGPDDAEDEDADAENESDAPGNGNAPDHAGQGNDGERGPPDHAGNGDGDGDDADDESDDADDESDDADDEDAEEDESDDADDEDAEEEESDADGDDEEEADDEDEDDDDDGGAGGPGNGNGNGPP